jgi:DNA polymerase III subunit delta
MPLRAEQLQAHLAGRLAPVYTVHGDEPLLAIEAADAIRAAARRGGFESRQVLEVSRNFDWSEFAHACAALALFGGRKLIELRLTSGKPGAEGAAAIERYCSRPNPDNLLLVTLPRLDRAGQASAWFGALGAAGVLVDIYPVERVRLPAWIAERLARQKQRASREVLELLAERVEGNLLAAHQEVQKLALLAPEGELTLEAVREAVANVARYDAYAASEALLAGELPRYARVIEGLRAEGEAPTYVLWALSEELRSLGRILAGLSSGRRMDDLLRENRLWGARQQAAKKAAARLRPEQVAASLAHAAAIDRAIKGVGPGEPWDEFLKLGMRLARAG